MHHDGLRKLTGYFVLPLADSYTSDLPFPANPAWLAFPHGSLDTVGGHHWTPLWTRRHRDLLEEGKTLLQGPIPIKASCRDPENAYHDEPLYRARSESKDMKE